MENIDVLETAGDATLFVGAVGLFLVGTLLLGVGIRILRTNSGEWEEARQIELRRREKNHELLKMLNS